MSNSPSEIRIKIPWRFTLLASAALTFVPAGHIAAPVGLFFLRFLNAEYRPRLADWVILTCAATGIVLSLVSWRRNQLSITLAAGVLYFVALAVAVSEWSSPLDLSTSIPTGIPFAGVAACIAWKCVARRSAAASANP